MDAFSSHQAIGAPSGFVCVILPEWALPSSVAKVGLEGGGTSAKPPDEGVSPEASAAPLVVGPTDCAVWRCALPLNSLAGCGGWED